MSSQQRCDRTRWHGVVAQRWAAGTDVPKWVCWREGGPSAWGAHHRQGRRETLVLQTSDRVWPVNTSTWTNTLGTSQIRTTWNAYYNAFSLAKPALFHLYFFVWWKTFKVILTWLKKMPSINIMMQEISSREWVVMPWYHLLWQEPAYRKKRPNE